MAQLPSQLRDDRKQRQQYSGRAGAGLVRLLSLGFSQRADGNMRQIDDAREPTLGPA